MNDFERWQARYDTPDFIFGEAPNEFLASKAALLPKRGRALAVADGEGRNGVWLAERGLDVLSIEFAPNAQAKARALAVSRGVALDFLNADVHAWDYPEDAFDVVVDIFTQFSTPQQRLLKWRGVNRALKPGGLLLLEGYAPKQLELGVGGPRAVENLYTREILEAAFGDFSKIEIAEYERHMSEGSAHSGMSALIDLVGWK